ncbi:MgtC/SapB family protein [Mangrovivirga cuniculi]|uniref:MgtC/SapB family protein n=1 Tax=Mangrovivirga cuniculi TaxID=2715131 RepID=A0A4D7K594_9BACT|nr:MgtC/SapB family protein [Mangrovivirga cuniculi]QCK14548.1 MgtC/SapB family protein [Mangrovivirga cuniculi]
MKEDITILAVALGLGLLVGLQRERGKIKIAGIRTFSLITLFGAVTGLVAREFNEIWLVAAGIIALAFVVGMANFLKRKEEEPDIGQTTEIAALLMYSLGFYLAIGNMTIGVVVGAAVALLLYLKGFFTRTIPKLGEKDIQAIMVFAAVSLIVLPILPDKYYGPYNVLNPQEIWLMVVLIVGLSVVGYFVYKWLGKRTGTGVSGVLGGLISSTATTATYSKLSGQVKSSTKSIAFIIIAASAVSFIRIIIEVIAVGPQFTGTVIPPLLIVAIVFCVISVFVFIQSDKAQEEKVPEPDNPAQFKTAIIFAVLYGIIILLIAFAKDKLGNSGLYIVSLLSGLTDVDAITLSMTNTMQKGTIDPTQGWKYIMVGGLSNLLFKGGMTISMASKRVTKIVIPVFLIIIGVGVVLIFIWPDINLFQTISFDFLNTQSE